MFKEKEENEEDLRTELGLTEERANELVDIVNSMIDQEAPDGGYGRTSHVLLNIAGRKDLNDVEKAVCIFIFCCNALGKGGRLRSGRRSKASIPPEICMPHMSMPGMGELKAKEFIDIEGGAAGMMIAPEGVGPEDAVGPLMGILMSMLRQMPKQDAKNFCRHASMSFAEMALTGDIRP